MLFFRGEKEYEHEKEKEGRALAMLASSEHLVAAFGVPGDFTTSCPSCGQPRGDDDAGSRFCRACREGGEGPTVMIDRTVEAEEAASIGGGRMPLSRVGDFDVLAKLGQGGMGAVYKARQRTLDRFVALKILPEQFSDDPDYLSRFRREAKVASSFSHPNLVRVYNYGSVNGCHYIAMELVEGQNLHQLLRTRRVDMAEALGITDYVAQGLKCGWDAAQLVHRDIKPSNIYLSFDGQVKVGDLGLAKSLASNTTGITHTGAMMGTPHYMSPEQCRGDKTIDFRADIYSLGCMLFEMLTGHPPYPGSDPVAIVNKHINAPPPGLLRELPDCPLPVALLVGRMLKKAPRERHASYDELITEIEALYEHIERGEQLDVTQFRKPTLRATPATTVSEGMPEWMLFAGALLVLVAGLILVLPKWEGKRGAAVKPAVATATPRALSTAAATPLPATAPAVVAVAPTAVAFGPWQPLLTDAEWNETRLGRHEVVDGRLHMQGPAALKSQPAADGAIRARIWFQAGSNNLGFEARQTAEGGFYKAELNSESDVGLRYFPPGSVRGTASEVLGQYRLPKPLRPGDTLLLELRLQGDRLTVLVDGTVAIEARDSRLSSSGRWGIIANDGWFEFAEVQTPLLTDVLTFAGHRYLSVKEKAQWAEAKAKAEAMGGHLVTINSKEENDWILSHLTSKLDQTNLDPGGHLCFIGAQRQKGSAGWEYVTGEPMQIQPWMGATFPDDPGNGAKIATISGSSWDDVNATMARLAFIVEWDDAGREQGWEDLLAQLTPDAVARTGWGLEGGVLRSAKERFAVVPLPGTFAGTSYQVGFKLRRTASNESISVFLPVADRMVQFSLDGHVPDMMSGLQRVGSKGLNADPGGVRGQQVNDNNPHDLEISVRLDGTNAKIAVTLDSHPFYQWTGAAASVDLATEWVKAPAGALALGSVTDRWEVSAVKVKRFGSSGATKDSPFVNSLGDDGEDLLAQLTPEQVEKTGQGWHLKAGELLSPAKPFAVLPLPGKWSDTSYRVRLGLRQLAGKHGFHVVIPVGNRTTGFDLDGFEGKYTGLSGVNGKRVSELPGAIEGTQITNGPHELEVIVRLDGANVKTTALLDTKPLYEWIGAIADLSQLSEWKKTEIPAGSLALGSGIL